MIDKALALAFNMAKAPKELQEAAKLHASNDAYVASIETKIMELQAELAGAVKAANTSKRLYLAELDKWDPTATLKAKV